MSSQQELLRFGASVAILWICIYLLNRIVPLKKYGFDIDFLFIKYESQRFKGLIDRVSGKYRSFWKAFSALSVVCGFGLAIYSLYFLLDNLLKFLRPGGEGVPVVPVLPGFTLQLYWLPYFVIAVVLAAIMHEFAHGVTAKVEGISIKSAGALLLAIFPAGFVELNDKDLDDSSTVSKLRAISVGSSANLLGWILVSLLLTGLFVQTPSGIVVIELLENGPIEQAGLQRWDIIYAVGNSTLRTYRDLSIFMANATPGSQLILGTSRGNISIVTAYSPDEPNRAIIGIRSPVSIYYPSRLGWGLFWDTQLYLTLNWLSLVLVNLAIFNMLPIPLLDGDKMFQYFLQSLSKRASPAKTFLNLVSLFLIAANIALSLGSGLFSF